MESGRLERILEHVKEIKSELYVGTKEAWNTIKALERIYFSLDYVVDKINLKLNDFLKKICYKATPERIWGINDSLVEATNIDGDNILGFKGEDIRRWAASCGAWRFNFDQRIEGIGFTYSDDDASLGRSVEFFFPIFLKANEEKISSDTDLGSIFMSILKNDYENIRHKIKEDKLSACDEYITKFLQELATFDWQEELSRSMFIQHIKYERGTIMDEELDIETIVKRVRYDRLDHKIEYRRSILAKFLTGQRIQDFVFEINKIGLLNYVNAQKICVMAVKQHQKTLRILQFDINNNKEAVKLAKENIDFYQFILELLAREKNWVDKFLKN